VNRLLELFSTEERRRVDVASAPATLRESIERYASVDLLITSRMHAAIFAMASGTPAIAVNYEPKVDGVMSLLGLGDRVVPADARLTMSVLTSLMSRLRSPAQRALTREAFARAGEAVGEFQARLA
jgi:polysaccharide pyruvyl transferase WcaK-like protein